MKIMSRGAVCLIGLAYLALAAQAGVVVQQEGGEPGANNPKQKATIYLDAGKLRMEHTMPDGKKTVMIFDQNKQVLWSIHPNGTYTEMTQADVEGMANQMSAAMKQMEEHMAQMTPEQRKMMEEMMKKRGGMGGGAAPAAPAITIQEKGSGEKVGPYATTRYEILSNGKRTSEVWAASRDQLHLQEDFIKTFQGMAKFYEPLSRNFPKGSSPISAWEQIKGFPVRTVSYDGDRVTHEWTVTNVEQRSLEGSLFTVPPGLKKVDMMGPGSMGHGGMGGPPPQR